MPDVTELQDLPGKIASEIKIATAKLKKEILCNFKAVNDWVFKTINPKEWVNLFYRSGKFDDVFIEGGGGVDATMVLTLNTGYGGKINVKCFKGKPVFNISTEVGGLTYKYYFDGDGVYVHDGENIVAISEVMKTVSDEMTRLETNVKDLKGNKAGMFVKMKAMANIEKKLKDVKETADALYEIEHLSREEYPQGVLNDQRAIEFLEKASLFITMSIPMIVQGVLDNKRKELARLRQLTSNEEKTVLMPSMDEIVKENDEHFKKWGHPEKI